LRRLVNSISELPRVVTQPSYEVADVITLEAILEAGLAVAAGFKLGTYRGRDRKLIFRPLIEPALTRTICIITHSERAPSPAAAALIESTIHHLRRRTDSFRLQGT
jgi:DNA-binding transcriptional LysR family regulator